MKKSLFEKMGLVERVDAEEASDIGEGYYPEMEEESVDSVTVNTDTVSTDNFITDVYDSNDLSDLSKSIFKVEEINKNLPDTMPKDTKQASVIGILSSFGLTSEDVRADADNRITILNAALEKTTNENGKIIVTKQDEIENAKKLIEECQKEIAECESLIKSSTEKVEKEIKRIRELMDFVAVNSEEGEE